MKRLTLHVGSHKTGTSSLQLFMVENAEYFEAHGLFVAQPLSRYPHALPERTACFLRNAAREKLGYRNAREQYRDLIDDDMRFVANAVEKHDHIYLSDERLWYDGAQDPLFWSEVKAAAEQCGFDEFRVVAYLRRQDEFIVSLWQQFAQHYLSSSLPAYLEDEEVAKLLDYHGNLQSMEEAFGRENIIVRIYDRDVLKGGDVRRDFVEAIGLEWTDELEALAQASRNRNPSLTFNAAEIKRISNSVPAFRRKDDFLRSAATHTANAHDKELSEIASDEMAAFFGRFAQGNAAIARDYFGREDGVLFADDKGPRGYSIDTSEMLYDLCYFFSEAIAEEHRKNVRLENKVTRLKRQVAKTKRRQAIILKRLEKLEGKQKRSTKKR